MIDSRWLDTEILKLLPEDGVLNRVMRVMLARRLERSIDDDSFFAARDALLADGKVGRLRGQGGQIFLTQPGPERARDRVSCRPAGRMQPLCTCLEDPGNRRGSKLQIWVKSSISVATPASEVGGKLPF